MPKAGLIKVSRARSLLRALRELSASLPSAAERDEAARSLKELSEYLEHVRKQLLSVPTSDDVAGLLDTIGKLDGLLDRAEANPLAARALGLEKAPKRRPSSPPSLADPAKAQAALERFESLTLDQVRDLLRSESSYSLPDLRALAAALGTRPQSRMGRDSLVQRIVTSLANSRGYRSLGTPADSAPRPAAE